MTEGGKGGYSSSFLFRGKKNKRRKAVHTPVIIIIIHPNPSIHPSYLKTPNILPLQPLLETTGPPLLKSTHQPPPPSLPSPTPPPAAPRRLKYPLEHFLPSMYVYVSLYPSIRLSHSHHSTHSIHPTIHPPLTPIPFPFHPLHLHPPLLSFKRSSIPFMVVIMCVCV